MAASVVRIAAPIPLSIPSSIEIKRQRQIIHLGRSKGNARTSQFPLFSLRNGGCFLLGCLPPSSTSSEAASSASETTSTSAPSTRLYVSGLSFRTTEESLRNAFQIFGQLLEVNLVMDKIANRPRGFAFLRYATVDESQKAIEGMHGKFLDGRVIFVEVAKPRSELRPSRQQNPRRY
ncbi:Glycine-rich RNA-binding protein like [Quillaja saponaria]|uniref:Glycine-rich RNA-binding protein like n=1 Tax=Quillaja saponaria TaxID=32244 RepID=A0AAD7M5L8_QUISA|nr:Glycine-rich RNA-binding protein like [Quillaja saponaria]